MPRYKLLEVSHFENGLRQAGDIVEYDGNPGYNLDPVDAEGRKRQKEFLEAQAEKGAINPNDPAFIRKMALYAAAEGKTEGE